MADEDGGGTAALDAAAVLDGALEAFITVDRQGRVTRWNPAAERTFGYTTAEALGRPVEELIIPDDYRDAHRHGLAAVAAGGTGRLLGQRLELPARHRDGHLIDVELTLNALDGPAGPEFFAFAHDITERRRAARFGRCELAVATALTSAHDTRAAGEAVLAAVGTTLDWPYAELWLADHDIEGLRCAARWSRPGTDHTPFHIDRAPIGSTAPGVAFSSGQPVWIPDVASGGYARSAIAAEVNLHVTLIVPILGGAAPLGTLAFFGSAVEDPEDLLMTLLSGIAAHVGQYLERRRAEELAVQLARTKDEFVALITHELRNPLSVIVAYGEMLLEDQDTSRERRRLLEAIGRNAANLSAIVNDLLDLARLESGQLTMRAGSTDLCTAVRDALDAAATTTASKRVTVTAHLPDRLAIPGDPTRLRQVADNLIGNAVKYTPPGGTVTVCVADRGDTAELTVADTGIGIPTDERKQLFDRFYRTPTSVESGIPGTGLGLVITRAIVESHRGTITIEDHTGPGTTFIVALPTALPSAVPASTT